jgi:peptidyl-prolyl cis-trans isomerase D
MLASMRTTASSIFMKAVMLLLVVAFAVWGVGDVVRSGNSGHVAKVGSESISANDYLRAASNLERMMQALGMGNVDRGMVAQQALRRLVEERMIEQRLSDAGFAVGTAQLAQQLRTAQAFHDVRGKFDPALFKATLAQRQISEAQLLSETATELRTNFFTQSLDLESITVPEPVAALYAASAAELRTAVLVTVPPASTPPADDKALQEYYDVNKELLYMQPQTRTLEFASFNRRALDALVEKQLTDEALQARYESDGSEKSFEESKAALRETLRSELADSTTSELSMQVEDNLAAGDSLGEAMKKAGLSASIATLSDVPAEGGKTPLEKAVIAQGYQLQEGESSNLQTSEDGQYFIVTARAVHEAAAKPLASVKADVIKRVAARDQAKATRERANAVKALLEGDDWEAALKKEGIATRSVAGIRRAELGGNAQVPAALNEAIFQHEVGGVAGPQVEENGSAVLARVSAITLPTATVKADPKLAAALSRQWQGEISQSYLRDLSARYPVRLNEPMLRQLMGEGDGA